MLAMELEDWRVERKKIVDYYEGIIYYLLKVIYGNF